MNTENTQPISHLRGIRSFVLRQGHLSPAQERAVAELLPIYGIPYQEKLIDLQDIFKRNNPKILEIGFGMGVATAEIAGRLPETDFIAVEVHTPGVGNLLKLIKEQELNNIRIIHHDAVEVIDKMIDNNALDGVHIFFPDPWHKKRHNKRRLIQTPFIEKLLPKIKSGGYIHLATDWEEYAQQMLEVLSAESNLSNTARDFAEKPTYRPETKFEARGKRLGHGVWDLVFRKK
ncbi:MAG: tRNA (guanosine(46)-N7)-methyltransferase TrmB [Neisseriaceae bacterium]|nr:tRNA (guanosine(46)-N7)-methyltransferase TrmB [Neisseriaceae bacterium]